MSEDHVEYTPLDGQDKSNSPKDIPASQEGSGNSLTPLTFVKDFVGIWPQTKKDGSLNYVIAGSLAMNLLAQATTIQDVESSTLIPVTSEIRNLAYSNKIKDVDVLYGPDPETLMDVFSEEFDKFERCKQKYSSISAHPEGIGIDVALEDSPITTKYKIVTIDGNEFYIAGLDAMIGHKLLSLVRTHKDYPETANTYIDSIYKAAVSVYGTEHISDVIKELFQYYRENLKHYDAFFGTLEQVESRLNADDKVTPFVKNMFSQAVKSSAGK